MLTTARLADRIAGHVQREDRAELPEDVADLGRDADRAGDRRRRRSGRLTIDVDERREAADDEPERIDRPLGADLDRLDRGRSGS